MFPAWLCRHYTHQEKPSSAGYADNNPLIALEIQFDRRKCFVLPIVAWCIPLSTIHEYHSHCAIQFALALLTLLMLDVSTLGFCIIAPDSALAKERGAIDTYPKVLLVSYSQ